MHFLILGASGRTGSLVLAEALSQSMYALKPSPPSQAFQPPHTHK